MDLSSLRTALEVEQELRGRWALSFFGENGLDLEEIGIRAGLPHRVLRPSTVGRIRAIGLIPRRDPPPELHVSIVFGDRPEVQDLARLVSVFDRPVRNTFGPRIES
jgi:hypothetical protein